MEHVRGLIWNTSASMHTLSPGMLALAVHALIGAETGNKNKCPIFLDFASWSLFWFVFLDIHERIHVRGYEDEDIGWDCVPDSWTGYIYYFSSILELNLGPDETFIWDLDFPDLLKSRCRHKVIKIWIWKVKIPYSMPIWAKIKT